MKYLTLTFNCSPATGVRIFPSGFGALGSGTGAVIIHEIYVENARLLLITKQDNVYRWILLMCVKFDDKNIFKYLSE